MNDRIKNISIDALLRWSFEHSLRPFYRYLIVALVIAVVAFIRNIFITDLLPWLLFIPVILFCGLVFGRNEGFFASVASALAAALSIGSLMNPYWLTGAQWTGSILFVAVTSLLALFTTELRTAYARAAKLDRQNIATAATLEERESFLSSVLKSSTDCIKVLNLDGELTFMTDGGMKVMEVSDFNAVQGCPWPEFWQGAGNAEAKKAVAAAREGKTSHFVGKANTMAGTPKWWDVAVSPILGADGRPERILSVSRDITASRLQEEYNRQLSRIIETSTDFIGMADLSGTVFFLNDAALNLSGLDRSSLGTLDIRDFFPQEEASVIENEILPLVAGGGHWSGERNLKNFRTGDLIPILYTVFPVLDTDGSVIGYGTVSRDFRDRKAAEAQMLLLNNELAHRLKNVLAIVQSVASQTLRQANDVQTANTAITSRLTALGEAAAVLTASSWESADLNSLVRSLLQHHGEIGSRIFISGPDIKLLPQGTLAFALAIHELATNAVKYGALSNETGRLSVSWRLENPVDQTQPNDQVTLFEFLWSEEGGPPVVAPTRKGFGSKMIERLLISYFKGTAQLKYAPTGLVFNLTCPLSAIGERQE